MREVSQTADDSIFDRWRDEADVKARFYKINAEKFYLGRINGKERRRKSFTLMTDCTQSN